SGGVAAADFVCSAQPTHADGRNGLQPSVSLVRGAGNGRPGVGRDRVHKKSERLMAGEISPKFSQAVLRQAGELLSDEHFTVDGSLIESWPSRRSFDKKADPPERGMAGRGRKLLRDTH